MRREPHKKTPGATASRRQVPTKSARRACCLTRQLPGGAARWGPQGPAWGVARSHNRGNNTRSRAKEQGLATRLCAQSVDGGERRAGLREAMQKEAQAHARASPQRSRPVNACRLLDLDLYRHDLLCGLVVGVARSGAPALPAATLHASLRSARDARASRPCGSSPGTSAPYESAPLLGHRLFWWR